MQSLHLELECLTREKRVAWGFDNRKSDMRKLCFLASDIEIAERSRRRLVERYGHVPAESAEIIVALGGDGFMLHVLQKTRKLDTPVYGMHRGTVGFLMNDYSEDDLLDRLAAAEEEVINPLFMRAVNELGEVHEVLAINEVSLSRSGPQAVRLRILVDGRVRLDELVCDGALVSTPAGSTAYNYSAHGPILPIGSDVLALTAVAAFRPRRWRGALLPKTAKVKFEVIESDKRPVKAHADGESFGRIKTVDVASEPRISYRLLFDDGHGLEERLIREQFV